LKDYRLEYEHKGIDYWWVLIYTKDGLDYQVGRGIVPDLLWDSFIQLFTLENNVMNIQLVERR